jgi:hypothetical protein
MVAVIPQKTPLLPGQSLPCQVPEIEIYMYLCNFYYTYQIHYIDCHHDYSENNPTVVQSIVSLSYRIHVFLT